MFTGYLINLYRSKDRLKTFNQHPDAIFFTRIRAFDKEELKHIPNITDLLFDSSYILSHYERASLNLGEICCTLSHIEAWKAVAQNETLTDEDYAVIAEDDIILSPYFSRSIAQLINTLRGGQANLVLLHKQGIRIPFWRTAISTGHEKILPIVFSPTYEYDNDGSALYLIRKSFAKEITEICKRMKPYWLADCFTIFCDATKIVVSNPLLGSLPENNNSYIGDRL